MDEKIKNILKNEEELPTYARQTFDDSYQAIRKKTSKKKKRWVTPLVALAAVSLLALLWQTPASDALMRMLGFGEFKSEEVTKSSFVQKPVAAFAEDSGLRISVKKIYSDENGLGIEFYVEAEDAQVTAEVRGIEYRLQNGDGSYITEDVSEDKPLHGDNHLISGGRISISEPKDGAVTITNNYDPREDQQFPKLVDPKVTVESLLIANGENQPYKRIEGNWVIQMPMEDVVQFAPIAYQAQGGHDTLKLEKAAMTPTGMRVEISYPADSDFAKKTQETFFSPVLETSSGEKFIATYYGDDMRDGRVYVSTVFRYTGYDAKVSFKYEFQGLEPLTLIATK